MANPYQTALMSRLNPNRNTGVSGIYSQNGQVNAPPLQSPGFVETPPEGPPPTLGTGNPTLPPPAVDTKAPQTFGMAGGFDPRKLADPTHNTERYQLGRVQEKHDPSLGITDAFLSDANALGIGDFYRQSGDRLGVRNARNGARWLEGTGDVIENFTGEGEKRWAPFMTEPEISAEMPSGGAPPMMLPPMNTGARTADFQDVDNSGIDDRDEPQQAGFDTQSPYLKALLAQLGL